MKVFLDTNSLWGQALLGGEEEKPPKRAWPQKEIFEKRSWLKGWEKRSKRVEKELFCAIFKNNSIFIWWNQKYILPLQQFNKRTMKNAY
jgi:hypothetical protein